MRLRLAALFLVMAVSACTFQVDVIETPIPSVTVAVEPSTSTPVPTLELSATPLLLPTFTDTPWPSPRPIVVTFPASAASPIVFPANGTYAIVQGNVPAGSSQGYALGALQGQVMSISVRAQDPAMQNLFQLDIRGSDGTRLCPIDNSTCMFWRGVLPSTQKYLVVVSSEYRGDYQLLVAINPLGTATQSFLYENKYRNASISYNDMFAPAVYPGAIPYRIEPELALQFIDTQSYAHTNLNEAYLMFGSSTDPQIVADCTEPVSQGAPERILGNVTINGVTFTESASTGVGAGNVYEQTYYRALQDGMCFEITYFIHYGNIGNYDPATVTEFNRGALIQSFDEVLSTFTLR